MLSNILDKVSFWSLFLTVVLLPAFFMPFSRIPVETSKMFLLVVGVAVSIIFWAAARFSDGKIHLPKSYIPLAGLLLSLIFFVSALFSGNQEVSFFGVMLDIGTFWFMFASFLLFLMSAVLLKEKKHARMVLYGTLIASAFVLVFQVLRFFIPIPLSLSVLGGKTANLVGAWNTFGVFVGLISLMSLFAVEFLDLTKKRRFYMTIFVVFTLIFSAIVNFALVWQLIGIFALLIFVYRISISSIGRSGEDKRAVFPGLSFAVVIVSLLFFMSGQFIGSILPSQLGLFEIEIGPSFGATMEVTGQALKQDPLFGVGPNKFSEIWALYKPAVINLTAFWDTSFNSGSGLLPTFASTTGIFGLLSWFLFFGLFLFAGVKMILERMKRREGTETTLFFLASLYLFVSAFFYSAGPVVLLLAFAFAGMFVGLHSKDQEAGEISFEFLDDPRKSFFSILVLVLIMIAAAGATFKFMERFASVYYFQKAVFADEISKGELAIGRAISLYPNDLYYRTYGNIHLLKVTSLVTKEGELTDEEKGSLQASLTEAVAGANSAISYNDKQYLNYQSLANVQQTLGRYGADGAYDSAIEAYKKALELNPLNPGLQLGIATSYLGQNKLKEAEEATVKSLELKPNYADAYVVMSRIKKDSGKNDEAIQYASQALALFPNDEALKQYVSSLRTGGNATPPASIDTGDKESSQ